MGQFGLFDADKRLAALSAKGDPLEAIDRLVPWVPRDNQGERPYCLIEEGSPSVDCCRRRATIRMRMAPGVG